MLHIGCCGFPVGFSRYVRELRTAEVQRTFYRIPGRKTVERWKEKAPAEFIFTVKAWQGITHPATSPTYRRSGLVLPDETKGQLGHFQPTEPVFEGWRETRELARILGAPVILLQAPPSFRETAGNEENLRGFFSGIDRGNVRIALELRSPWDRAKLLDLCREFDLIHCVDPFGDTPVTGSPFYLRLHGSPPGKRMYAYRYTAEDLAWLRDRILGLRRKGDIYCLFNNLSMWDDALAFRDLLMADRGGRGP